MISLFLSLLPIFRNSTSLFPKVIFEKTENTISKNADGRMSVENLILTYSETF